jgi:RNA polymerase sigma-B factor
MADNAEEKNRESEEANELFLEYAKTKDEGIRNRIVERYLYLADAFSRKYIGRGVDRDDLYQVAAMALVFAVERFDASKGIAFSSFAVPTIIGEIKKYFRDKSWAVKVPRHRKELALRIADARELLQSKLGRPPTVPELAEYLGSSDEDILEALEAGRIYRTYSLNQEQESESGGESLSPFEQYMSVDEEGYEGFENMDVIKHVWSTLSDTERKVFRKRMLGNMPQRELAEEVGVSQVSISRIEAQVREKFRKEYYRVG